MSENAKSHVALVYQRSTGLKSKTSNKPFDIIKAVSIDTGDDVFLYKEQYQAFPASVQKGVLINISVQPNGFDKAKIGYVSELPNHELQVKKV